MILSVDLKRKYIEKALTAVHRKSTGIRGAETQNRTGDTRIFSPLLYRLSYLGTNGELNVSK